MTQHILKFYDNKIALDSTNNSTTTTNIPNFQQKIKLKALEWTNARSTKHSSEDSLSSLATYEQIELLNRRLKILYNFSPYFPNNNINFRPN